MEETIVSFVSQLSMTTEQITVIAKTVPEVWDRRQYLIEADQERFEQQIKELEMEAQLTVMKLKYLESETAIKYMEGDLVNIGQKIKALETTKDKKNTIEPINMSQITSRVTYFLENLDKLLLKQIDPVKKVQFFAAIFDRIPTYEEIKTGTKNSAILPGVNALFQLAMSTKPVMVAPPRLELGTRGSSGRCSTN